MKILDSINTPSDLKKLNTDQLNALCSETREFLVDKVLCNGGHLASNLGIVELTVTLLKSFDLPNDKVIYDVGHQSYVHKLLTGRKEGFDSLRSFGGMSGFPKTSESPYDSFNTGHASTSISAALGMARARDLKGEKHNIIAVIGDGSLTGGMAFEGINDAGSDNTKLIVVLNDNEMSIEKNVGSLSQYLDKIRNNPRYSKAKDNVHGLLKKLGKVGVSVEKGIKAIKKGIKYAYSSGTLFECLGFKYIGILDGNNIDALCEAFERAKNIDAPVIIHILTKKGLGFADAENNPGKYHGVSRMVENTSGNTCSYSSAFGDILCDIASNNKDVVAITAAMPSGCGLTEFSQKFPNRFFDVGIAEEHAVTMSAGLAISGITPVVCIYSTFLQRAYDQILHDVCQQNLHVVFAIDRSGIVGEDGETHQGVFDLSYLLHIPNMTVLSPTCHAEFEAMMAYAVNECNGPVAIRYPRGGISFRECAEFNFANVEHIAEGDKITLVTAGNMLDTCVEVGKILAEKGINADIFNIRTVKPFDRKSIENSLKNTRFLVTVEDNMKSGGMGEMLRCSFDFSFKSINFGYDCFIPHGSPQKLYDEYGMSAEKIADKITKECHGIAE